MHFTLCVKGDVIVFTLDPKPGVFAADNLPRPADNTNNVLLLGFRQCVPPQIPYHYQRLSVESKFPLPHSPVYRILQGSKKAQLIGWSDRFQFCAKENSGK